MVNALALQRQQAPYSLAVCVGVWPAIHHRLVWCDQVAALDKLPVVCLPDAHVLSLLLVQDNHSLVVGQPQSHQVQS